MLQSGMIFYKQLLLLSTKWKQRDLPVPSLKVVLVKFTHEFCKVYINNVFIYHSYLTLNMFVS